MPYIMVDSSACEHPINSQQHAGDNQPAEYREPSGAAYVDE